MSDQQERQAGGDGRHPALPPVPATFVDRSRLTELLTQALRNRFVLVSAPAGTGKTVAVAAWARSGGAGGPVHWARLDEASPGRAEQELVAARDAAVVVLDCERALGRDEARGLDRVLQAGSGPVLVLLTRSDPVLPLHRYRLAGQLAEMRAADLALTGAEVRRLVARHGVRLSAPAADALAERTRGWVAGVVLAALSLADEDDPDAAALAVTGSRGTVAEYLLNEVLDAQPAPARELLLRTSVAEDLPPGLAEVLAGPGAGRALSFLVRGNVFVEPLTGPGEGFRYHPLFRELLLAQLTYEAPGTAAALHRAAASWSARHGLAERAVRHSVAAGDWQDAAGHLVADLGVGELLLRGTAAGPGRALQDLPEDVDGEAAALVRAALAASRGDVTGTDLELAVAGRPRGIDPDPTRAGGAPADVAALLLEAVTGARDEPEQVLGAVGRARELLPVLDQDRLAGRPELRGLLDLTEAGAAAACGDLAGAGRALTAAAASRGRPGCEGPAVAALGRLALLEAFRGGLRRAAELLSEHDALAAGEDSAVVRLARAWVLLESGSTEDAAALLRPGTGPPGGPVLPGGPPGRPGPPGPGPLLDGAWALALARVLRDGGEPVAAAEELASARRREVPGWLADRLGEEEVRSWLAADRPDRAAAVMRSVAGTSAPTDALARLVRPAAGRDAEDAGADEGDAAGPVPAVPADRSLGSRVQAALDDAWLLLRRGDTTRALRRVETALQLAAPERLRRPFLAAPPELQRLLRRPDLAVRHGWLEVRAVPAPRRPGRTGQGQAGLPEALTEKEQEVLEHLAQLLTTEEVAAAMFISVNTVRTHVRNILRKLSASRRNEAVRRARDLGLLEVPGPGTPSFIPRG